MYNTAIRRSRLKMLKRVLQIVFDKNSQSDVDFSGTAYYVDDGHKSKIYFLNNDTDEVFEVSKRTLQLKKLSNNAPIININKSDRQLCGAVKRHAVLVCYFQHRGYVLKNNSYRYFIKLVKSKNKDEQFYFNSFIEHYLEYENQIIQLPYLKMVLVTETLIEQYIAMFFIDPKYFVNSNYLSSLAYDKFNEISKKLNIVTKESVLEYLILNKLMA